MAAKRLSSKDRKKQIADTAACLFAKKGFDGVTTREIAKKAGVNEAILFRHFPTKEALYTEIINRKIEVKPDAFDFKAIEEKNDSEVFRSIAKYFIKEVDRDNTLLRLMLYSALEDHELASVFLKSRTTALFDFLNDYVAKRTHEGAFKNVKAAVAMRAFVGMFFHFIMVKELFRVPRQFDISNEEALNNFVEIFLNGIKK